MRKITKRSAAIIAATALAVGGAGAAWAAWTLSGSATATVSAGSAVPLTVTNAALTGSLVVGSTSGVTLKISNNNAFPVSVTGATISDISGGPACGSANFDNGTGAFPTTAIAKNADAVVAWPDAIKMQPTAVDGCQGATVTFNLAVSGVSAAS
jgi:hypothetical protein